MNCWLAYKQVTTYSTSNVSTLVQSLLIQTKTHKRLGKNVRMEPKHLKENWYSHWVRLPSQSGLLEYKQNTSTGRKQQQYYQTTCSSRNNFGAWVRTCILIRVNSHLNILVFSLPISGSSISVFIFAFSPLPCLFFFMGFLLWLAPYYYKFSCKV